MAGPSTQRYFSGNVGTNDPFQGWSEERKRFFHQYGYDRGPGVLPVATQRTRGPKVKETITETDPSDPTPTKKVTTIDYPDQPAPTFERDQFTRAGMGGFTGGARMYDMAADPSWSDATAINVQQAQPQEVPIGGLLASPEVAGYGESIGAMPPMGYGESIGAMPPYESPAPGVQFDEYAPRRGEGGMADFDERGMQQYWQDVARRKQRQQNIGAPDMAQQYEGGDETDNIMNAIKMAESRGDPLAHNPGTPENPEDSLGLYQINWDFWGKGDAYDIINNATKSILGKDLEREDLFNEFVNEAAAYAIQESEGFEPWSTYKDGTYLQHMEEDPNLFQRAGSGIVEGIKSAWGEPTTKSGVGFDKPPHTDETPDYTREDAPEGIPQEIYNQLRDNYHFGSQLGVISEAGAAEGALPGSSYIGRDDRESALAFQAERDRKKRIQDQMAQGQMPPPRYEDTGLLAGPSEEELAESTARLTSPALALRQREGEKFHAPAVLGLDEQDYIAGLPEGATERFDARGQLEGLLAGEPQVLFIDEDTGQPVTIQDIAMMQIGGVGGISARMLKGLSLQRLKKLWQQFKGRGAPQVKPGGGYQGGKAERFEKYRGLLEKPIPGGLRPTGTIGGKVKYPTLTAREKALFGGTAATLAGTEYIRRNVEKLPWVFKRGVERAGDLGEKIEQVVTEEVIPTIEEATIGLLETPEEHEYREQLEAARKDPEDLPEYGRERIEEETFAPPPIGLLEEVKPIEVAEMSQADLHDKMVKDWTPYKDAVADMNARDIERTASEPLDKGLNRIWANFPTDIEGRRDRYLQALGEIYKKVAILNVIAALTNSPSMAPQFMEMAAARFKTLEGFRGEERLQDIAKGVYFTQDGKFDAPKSKESAYERAIQFGASAKEAATISGYMVDEEEEEEEQYYRDDGKGGWETIRSDTDPRGTWTRGNPPAARSPSAATTATGTALTRNIASYQGHLDAADAAEQAGDTSLAAEHKAIANIYYRHLNKEGTKESRSDLFDRLYDYYWDANKGLVGLKSGSPDFKDWLLTDQQGIFHAKMHLGSDYADVIQGSPVEMKEVRKEGGEELPLATRPATREEAEKQLRAENPHKDYPDLTKEQYETRIERILDEEGY